MELRLSKQDNTLSQLSIAYKNLKQENQELRDSLYYASSVQQGLMPQARHFKKLGNPYFIFYRPARIIGGDFFWLGKKGNWVLYAVGDCTGHSLSGAMLSTLAVGFLNYLVYSKNYMGVGEILNELDKKWIETFKHDDDEEVNNDWMEIALIAYNPVSQTLQYASAKRKVLILTPHDTITLAGNNYPIGGWQIEKNRNYTTQEFKLAQPFKAYLFSDGLQDQFGGPKNKRLGMSGLYDLLTSFRHLTPDEQALETERRFTTWMAGCEQTDDVCLLGVEFN